MRSCKLRDEEKVRDSGHALNIKDNKITNSIAYNKCSSPSVAGSFYKSFTLLNGSSHQTLNVLHLRFIFTSQLHKAGLQCCKAQFHQILMACWGGEHCEMCPEQVRGQPPHLILMSVVGVWDCVK